VDGRDVYQGQRRLKIPLSYSGQEGKTIDFLLTAKRDTAAAKRFFNKAMEANGTPEKVMMDKSGANKASIDEISAAMEIPMVVRQIKYLNNIVGQDHRAVKRITKPMFGFKSFPSAKRILDGIELMHMIRNGQLMIEGADNLSFADQFYALAGKIRSVWGRAKYICQESVLGSLLRHNQKLPILMRFTPNSYSTTLFGRLRTCLALIGNPGLATATLVPAEPLTKMITEIRQYIWP
jgi:hypothetical protein